MPRHESKLPGWALKEYRHNAQVYTRERDQRDLRQNAVASDYALQFATAISCGPRSASPEGGPGGKVAKSILGVRSLGGAVQLFETRENGGFMLEALIANELQGRIRFLSRLHAGQPQARPVRAAKEVVKARGGEADAWRGAR